eukprot:scaffold6918_cov380-Prasinococcus_capsulatus_cf.AAC.4
MRAALSAQPVPHRESEALPLTKVALQRHSYQCGVLLVFSMRTHTKKGSSLGISCAPLTARSDLIACSAMGTISAGAPIAVLARWREPAEIARLAQPTMATAGAAAMTTRTAARGHIVPSR